MQSANKESKLQALHMQQYAAIGDDFHPPPGIAKSTDIYPVRLYTTISPSTGVVDRTPSLAVFSLVDA